MSPNAKVLPKSMHLKSASHTTYIYSSGLQHTKDKIIALLLLGVKYNK